MTREQILERARVRDLIEAKFHELIRLEPLDENPDTYWRVKLESLEKFLDAAAQAATPSEDGWRPASEAPDGMWVPTWREGEKHTSIASKRAWLDGDDEWCAPNGKTTVTHSTYLPPTHYFRVPPPPLPDTKG